MIRYSGVYCIEQDANGQLYKRTRISGKRFDIFPMKTAYIIYDTHDNWILATMMFEPIARGTSGGKAKAEQVARELQPDIRRFTYENPRYITRGGIVVTENVDVYKIG
ncbi:hypothetical protein ACFFIS_04760 [Virgibacillus soli]|uniref:hypothetical protein n=1 Tax=Paracerasibacillus soli TaxID=480284 RepID=UPI0035E8FF6A